MIKKYLLPWFFILFSVLAEEAPKNSEKVIKQDNGDIDKEVRNPRLRAISGSKSKWSLSFALNYRGGTVSKPFGMYRPDIYGNPENERLTSFGGSLSGRYRFDRKNSVTLGFGFSYLAPFRDDGDINRDQFNVDNPGIGYSRIEKVGIFQISSGIDYIHGTAVSYKEQSLVGLVSLGLTFLTDFNASAFNLGLSIGLTDYFYDDEAVVDDQRTLLSLGFYPFFEYKITQVLYFRTVFGFLNYEIIRSDGNMDLTSMRTTPHYQSLGLGIAASRDIYIYPNVQFLPKDWAYDKTNFSVTATINIL
jgi:hypothetical protein